MRPVKVIKTLKAADRRLHPGEERFRRSVLLPTLFVFVCLCLVYGVLGFGYGIGSPFFPWDWLELCAVTALCAWFRRAGLTTLAAVSLLVVSSHPISFIVARYGLQSPAPAMFLPTIALSGLIVGRRIVLLWGAVCVGLILWLGIRVSGVAHSWPTILGWSLTIVLMTAIVELSSKKLEQVLAAVIVSEEAERMAILCERARIARDLHDAVAQSFTGIVLHLRAAELHPAGRSSHLAKAISEAREGLQLSKDAVWSLRREPVADLRHTIERSAEQILNLGSVRWSLAWEGQKAAGSPELAAIVKEAMVNVLRHAQATMVSIAVKADGNRLQLSIADDGVGLRGPEGFGIKGMRERAAALGGRLEVNSPQEGGCRLELTIDG